MGHRHTTTAILDSACDVVADEGLAALTFRAVGRRAGIPDRTVVYYFPTKDALLAAVIDRAAQALVDLVAAGDLDRSRSADEVLSRVWGRLATPEGDAAFRFCFEVVGGGVRGAEPFASRASGLVGAWISWVAGQLDEPHPYDVAAGVVATLDGLMLLRTTAGAEVAAAAARGLGIKPLGAARASSTG